MSRGDCMWLLYIPNVYIALFCIIHLECILWMYSTLLHYTFIYIYSTLLHYTFGRYFDSYTFQMYNLKECYMFIRCMYPLHISRCIYVHGWLHITFIHFHMYICPWKILYNSCTFQREVGGWGREPFSRNLMSPTPRRKWYLTTGRRAH